MEFPGEQLQALSDALLDSQSCSASYLLDVIGGPLLAARTAQSCHRDGVFLKVTTVSPARARTKRLAGTAS
jgi:hypothetical protein